MTTLPKGTVYPTAVHHAMQNIKAPTVEGFFSLLSKLREDEENWSRAPGREKIKGMKYPIVKSDDLVPFIQSVLSAHRFGYTMLALVANTTPAGVEQTLWWIVYHLELGEGCVYHLTWVSPTNHNEQAGGITRATRRFLQGLTGFVEHDEDGLQRDRRAKAVPVNTGYQQQQQPPQPVPQQQQQPINGAGQAGHEPQTMGREGQQSGGIVKSLTDKGFDFALANDLVQSGPRGWEVTLTQNAFPTVFVQAFVGVVADQKRSFLELPSQLEEEARFFLIGLYGEYDKAIAAFAGTGLRTGESPNAIQWLGALMRMNMNGVMTMNQQPTTPGGVPLAEADIPF
jgi:hypothetical protein